MRFDHAYSRLLCHKTSSTATCHFETASDYFGDKIRYIIFVLQYL